jgi:hypothetical protein
MRTVSKALMLGALVLSFTACATIPTGPSVMVLPGSQKSFETFQAEDEICRSWADQSIGISPAHAAGERAVAGGAIGTAMGAAAGAAIGAASHAAGPGAAIGAGAGLLLGTAGGASQGAHTGMTLQRSYDAAYMQCMYAKGNQIPVARGVAPEHGEQNPPPLAAAPRPRHLPPPPAGPPPPPPPDA